MYVCVCVCIWKNGERITFSRRENGALYYGMTKEGTPSCVHVNTKLIGDSSSPGLINDRSFSGDLRGIFTRVYTNTVYDIIHRVYRTARRRSFVRRTNRAKLLVVAQKYKSKRSAATIIARKRGSREISRSARSARGKSVFFFPSSPPLFFGLLADEAPRSRSVALESNSE